MKTNWKRWLAVALAVCMTAWPVMTVSATEPNPVIVQEEQGIIEEAEPVEEEMPVGEETPVKEETPVEEEMPVEPESDGTESTAKTITGFAEWSEEEQYYEVEQKISLDEINALLGETITVYLDGVEEAVVIEVSWQCTADYENVEDGIYYFYPVWDEELYQAAENISFPQKEVEIIDETFEVPPLTYMDVDDEVDSVTMDPDYDGPVYAALETKYDPLVEGINLPDIRNQNPYGTCWAHSSVGLGEMAYYKNNPSEDDMELSELHLSYFAYNGEIDDPLDGLDGDSNKNVGEDFLNRGGNLAYSYPVLAAWIGAAAEETAPYGNAADALANGLDASIAFTDRMHLQGVYKINMKTDQDIAKQMIKEYGAVGISYYEDSKSHNSTYTSYYQSTQTSTNHAVMIVGWDDDFPKENFTNTPEGDGAWLIRNSWGGTSTGYNRRSYFWLSYYDTSIASTGYVFIYEDADNYDHNYQYDGGMFSGSMYSSSNAPTIAANVFTAKANPSGGEVLRAVSFDTPTVNVNYKVEIYTGLTDSADPESGTLIEAATTTGVTTAAGYYTVPLKADVLLAEGTDFSVVVTLEKESETPRISTEYSITANWFDTVASIEEGKSFIKWYYTWRDMQEDNASGASYSGNIRIKAFTDSYSETKPVTAITFSETEKELNKGDSITLVPIVTPTDADSILTWTSSDASVAVVDKNGTVTAVGAGSADITVSAKGISATCTVTVKAPAQSIQISESTVSLQEDETYQPTATVDPADTTDEITWSSSDSSIASVDTTGRVTAKKAGTATITVAAGQQSADCVVTVTAKEIKAESISLNKTSMTLTKGNSEKLTANITPVNTTSTVSWSSSDTSVATVTNDGVVTATGAGKTDITVAADGVSATCTVTVKVETKAVALTEDYVQIKVGGIYYLVANVTPSDATDTLTWSSSDSSVVTVDANGKITGKKEGTAKITVKAGACTDVCEVEVTRSEVKLEAIAVKPTSVTLNKGKTIPLGVTITPSDAAVTLQWSSSNPAVAAVSQSGIVSAKGVGSAVITVSAGGVSSSCKVTVKSPAISVSIADSQKTIYVGSTTALTATVLPADTTDALIWKSSDSSIAAVDSNGNVTGRKEGTVTITASAGSYSDTCTVTVKNVPAGTFIDVGEDDWFKPAVDYVYTNGIMSGVGNNQFAPIISTDRAMIVQILYNIAGKPSVSGSGRFTDVPSNAWYAKAVQWAVENDVTAGISPTEFAPERAVTRQEVASFLYRFAKVNGYNTGGRNDLTSYTDSKDVAGWALESMQWANNAKIINGKGNGTLDPTGSATRAEVASMMRGFMMKYE